MAELLSFASPKESNQRKGEPVAFSMFGLRRAFLLATGLAPAAGLTFLCFAKEKISKRKASQRPWPFGLPCATRGARGRAQTRYAQTSARPDPRTAALLSTANGQGSPNTACARSLRSPCTRFLARFARCRGSPRFRHDKQNHNHTHSRNRSRANHQSIDYDRIVSQSRPANPHRNLPHQHPSPAQNNQIGYSSAPSPRRG